MLLNDDLARAIVNGLSLGCLIGLLSVGYSLVYGVSRIINFAHGDLLALSGYYFLYMFTPLGTDGVRHAVGFIAITTVVAGFSLGERINLARPWRIAIGTVAGLAILIGGQLKEGRSLPFGLAVVLALLFTVIAGAAFEYLVYRPLEGAPRLSFLVAAIGLSLCLQGSMQLFFGTQRRLFPHDVLAHLVRMPMPSYFNGYLSGLDFLIVVVTLILTFVSAFLAKKSLLGLSIRAVADDPGLAMRQGLSIRAPRVSAFAAGAGLAGICALFFVARQGVLEPTMGYSQGIIAFSAAVIGGIGRLTGALLGGIFIGLVLSVLPLIDIQRFVPASWVGWFPSMEISDWGLGLVYALMAIVLAIRPRGLVAERQFRDI